MDTRPEGCLFYVKMEVASHISKKNSRPILKNRKTGRMFIGKSGRLNQAENLMLLILRSQRNSQKITESIKSDVSLVCRFYFNDYYAKAGHRRKNLPDLSNLYEIVQDQLQKAEIIENDTLICSHDGSRRMPSPDDKNYLEIAIYPFT